MAALMTRLGSKVGGKVADARQGEAQGASVGIASRPRAVAWLLALALPSLAVACEGGAAPSLPDPGPSGIAFAIKSEPSGAAVTVDGVAVGTTPAQIKLRPGPHRVRGALSGYYPAPETRVQVGASEPAELTLHLVPSH